MKIFCLAIALLFSHSVSAKISFSYQDFAPFTYQKEGRAQGIMIEMLKLVCIEMNEQCEFKYYPNKRAKDYMARGLVHGNLPLGWNVSRKEWIHFSVPLLTTSYSFFGLQKSNFNYTKLADLEGLVIGVFGPSNTQFSLEKIQHKMIELGLVPIEIDRHSNADGKGLIKVIKERYGLYYVNSDLANYRIKNLQLQGIENKGRYKSLEYHVGFAKKYIDKKFLVRFNRTVLKLYRDAAFKAIWQKWHSEAGNIDPIHLRELDILH